MTAQPVFDHRRCPCTPDRVVSAGTSSARPELVELPTLRFAAYMIVDSGQPAA
jgi:hypothetical protein